MRWWNMQCAAANMCCCLQSRLTSPPQIPDFFHVLHFPSGLACQKPFFRAALLQGSPSSGQRFFRTFKAAAGVRDAQVQGVYLHLNLGPHMYTAGLKVRMPIWWRQVDLDIHFRVPREKFGRHSNPIYLVLKPLNKSGTAF